MRIVRRTRADIDSKKLRAELAAQPLPAEAEIDAQAAENGNAWTEEDVARAVRVHPAPTPAQVRALRVRLGLTQMQFARQFGFSIDAGGKLADYFRLPSVQHYLLVRPLRREIIHHRRTGDRIETIVVDDGDVELDPPGIRLSLDEVYAT